MSKSKNNTYIVLNQQAAEIWQSYSEKFKIKHLPSITRKYTGEDPQHIGSICLQWETKKFNRGKLPAKLTEMLLRLVNVPEYKYLVACIKDEDIEIIAGKYLDHPFELLVKSVTKPPVGDVSIIPTVTMPWCTTDPISINMPPPFVRDIDSSPESQKYEKEYGDVDYDIPYDKAMRILASDRKVMLEVIGTLLPKGAMIKCINSPTSEKSNIDGCVNELTFCSSIRIEDTSTNNIHMLVHVKFKLSTADNSLTIISTLSGDVSKFQPHVSTITPPLGKGDHFISSLERNKNNLVIESWLHSLNQNNFTPGEYIESLELGTFSEIVSVVDDIVFYNPRESELGIKLSMGLSRMRKSMDFIHKDPSSKNILISSLEIKELQDGVAYEATVINGYHEQYITILTQGNDNTLDIDARIHMDDDRDNLVRIQTVYYLDNTTRDSTILPDSVIILMIRTLCVHAMNRISIHDRAVGIKSPKHNAHLRIETFNALLGELSKFTKDELPNVELKKEIQHRKSDSDSEPVRIYHIGDDERWPEAHFVLLPKEHGDMVRIKCAVVFSSEYYKHLDTNIETEISVHQYRTRCVEGHLAIRAIYRTALKSSPNIKHVKDTQVHTKLSPTYVTSARSSSIKLDPEYVGHMGLSPDHHEYVLRYKDEDISSNIIRFRMGGVDTKGRTLMDIITEVTVLQGSTIGMKSLTIVTTMSTSAAKSLMGDSADIFVHVVNMWVTTMLHLNVSPTKYLDELTN